VDGDADQHKWSVTTDGTKLTFTLADLNDIKDYPFNEHFDVSLTGVEQSNAKATPSVYAGTVGYTAGTGIGSATATINYTDEKGEEHSVDVAFDVKTSAATTAGNLRTALGKIDDLKDAFTIGGSNASVTLTANQGGTTVKVNSFTVDSTSNNGTPTASIADDATNTVEGKEGYTQGTNGYTNAATTVDIAVDKKTGDTLASTTLDLSGKLTDGAKITLGDQTYTIALGADSKFKDVENAVYVANQFKPDGKTLDEELIASKLAEVAANNTTFSVGHVNGDNGKITLKQLQEVKDSTDMSTMEKFASYIGISSVDKSEADPVLGKALTLQIGDTSDSYNQLSVSIKDMHSAALGIADIDISSQESASKAINTIKTAINTVSSTRGTLGATQNRLEHTSNNLSVMSENIQDAESTIRDTDIAEEMMSYTKNNILVQSAQAMLAQANSVPQGVLQLLQ
jgi:flagellin